MGDSGAGKSTQLRKLVLDVARRQLDLTDFEQLIAEPLPIYIQAETMAGEPGDLTTTLSRVIERELGLRLPFPLADGFLDSRQPGAAASLLVVIDGLDEIAPERRDALVASLRRYGDSFGIVLGSRARLPQHDIAHVEIEEPTSEQSDALLQKLTELQGGIPSRWPGLPRNPLILTLAALLQRQDSLSRATLYREFLIDRMLRSLDPAVPDPKAGLSMLEACALAGGDLADSAEVLTAMFLPAQAVGLARGQMARRLLVSTGAIQEMGEQLSFLHESFRSFLKAEALARRHRPSPAPWDKVSPFREGWEVLGFMIEIWRRDGGEVAPALEGLLAFGEAGLRLIGQMASRDAGLPVRVIETVVAKWMHGDEDDWSPGMDDGPIQQLGLMARHYECARVALRRIARNNWTYQEDAAYAAQALARAGLSEEGRDLLVALSRNEGLWEHRALAVDLLSELGSLDAARMCALELATELPIDAIDPDVARLRLVSTLCRLGEKRTAERVLRQVENEVDEYQGLKCLAEACLELGKLRKAKAAACRAFHTWEWSTDLRHGSEWTALSLLNLLDQVGAKREAEEIRDDLEQAKGKSAEDLVEIVHDWRKSSGKRVEAADELLKRHRETGIAALQVLLNDNNLESYRRFAEVAVLLDSPARQATIETLRRIAADEPWHRVECGSALVNAGEPEDGWALLAKVALEPAEKAQDRVRAIEHLARSGRVDLAMSAFRRIARGGALDYAHLGWVEAALAYTAVWAEYLDICEWLLAADDRRLRIEALAILIRSGRITRGANRATHLLSHIVQDRKLDPEIRAKALSALENMDEDATELAIDIATHSDESMEAGLMAMHFLERRDSFYATDCGHDVVWDKKLSADQFIDAAHRFLGMVPATDQEADGLKYWGRGMADVMLEELVQIAADPDQPVDRRMAAAGITGENGRWRTKAIGPARDAICADTSLSLRVRLPALHDLFIEDPDQYNHWKNQFLTDHIGRVEAAYTCLTGNIWMRDVAAEFFYAALEEEQDPHLRVRIWEELVELVEGHFAGAEAATALEKILQAKGAEADSDLVISLLQLSKYPSAERNYEQLVIATASSEKIDIHAADHIARELIDLGLEAKAADLLQRLKLASLPSDKGSRSIDYLLTLRAMASMGQRRQAIEDLSAFCTNPKRTIFDRALACRILSQLGETRAANRYLEALAGRAGEFEDKLTIADIASDQHNWGLARRVLLALRAVPASLTERCRLAAGLAKAGLKESAMATLKGLDARSPEFLWAGGIDLLLESGEVQQVAAICEESSPSTELCIRDWVEVLRKLGEAGQRTTARRLLINLIEGQDADLLDKADGATVLHHLGFKAEARSILFSLAVHSQSSASSAIWLADAMLECGLSATADSILTSIKRTELDEDERDRLAQMEHSLRHRSF